MTMHEELTLLALIVTANAAPILLDDLLGRRFAWPLDGGKVLADGRRLLGGSATVRGVLAAVAASTGAAMALGQPAGVGALVGLLAMTGDALSSFVKRRLDLAPGTGAPGLDQIPEALLPLLAVAGRYGFGWWDIGALVLGFVLFDLAVSRLLYRMGLRKEPH